MTPEQIELSFSSHLVTVGMLKGLAKQQYGAKDTDICRVFITRKSMCDLDDFVVRADDCLKISLVRDGELVLYKHGGAKTLLLAWGSPNSLEATACPKCKVF